MDPSGTRYATMHSPVGELLVAGRAGSIRLVWFLRAKPVETPDDWVHDPSAVEAAFSQLDEYFQGRRTTFDLVLDPIGTPFQREVWRALQAIPYGETRSYGQLARAIGRPAASRAVGAANGANPLPIVIPCHRVIGSAGSLTGFGGGLAIKRFLLDLEAGTPGFAFEGCPGAESSAASYRPA